MMEHEIKLRSGEIVTVYADGLQFNDKVLEFVDFLGWSGQQQLVAIFNRTEVIYSVNKTRNIKENKQ